MFSDEESTKNEMEDFIDDTDQSREDISFYRESDPSNLEHYHKFTNQTTNPRFAVDKDDKPYFGDEGVQPELYVPENRDNFERSIFLV